MRILFLTRRFYPDIGGVEKHVWEISNRLAKKGHQITILTQSLNNKRELKIKNITVVRIPKKIVTKFSLWSWLYHNKQMIVEADIVHCHDVFYWYLPFRFLYPLKPVYTTFHGYESFPIKKKAIIVRKISELLSFGNLCIGDFISKWYFTRPTAVSYGAVESSVSTPSVPKNYAESALFFGRLDSQTGIKTYIKAYELLKKKYRGFKLLVVGEGKDKRFIEKKTKVMGFRKNPEQFLTKYRFAFVSRYLSMLEAFAAKRLVFAVYDDPIKEDYLRLAPFAQFIVIAKTPSELARKIQFFIAHPELEQKLVTMAHKWVRRQNWENMVKLYLAIWKMNMPKKA